jgi:outer membrane receptor protein involved in Fe transport
MVSLSGGVSHVRAKVQASGAALPLNGRRPAQTPRTTIAATAEWRHPGGAAVSLSGRYVASQYEDDLESQRLPDALSLDAVAAVPLGRRLRLEARAENITDARVVAGISGAGVIERATPRTLWIGLAFAQ